MKQLDNQTAFTLMVQHMRAQGKQARNLDGTCAYRTQDGLRCAVGVLIPEEWESELHHQGGVTGFIQQFPRVAAHLAEVDKDFLRQMQVLHDDWKPDDDTLSPKQKWERGFACIARVHNLEIPPCNTQSPASTPSFSVQQEPERLIPSEPSLTPA